MNKVAILCSGLDEVMRGYESHTRLLFDSLRKENAYGKQVFLFKGSGKNFPHELVLRVFKRNSIVVSLLKKMRGDGLYWEYLLFAIRFIVHCRLNNKTFDRILIIEPMAAKTITKFKLLLPGSPLIIFTHGVWIDPEDYHNMGDVFHQPNIENYNKQQNYFNKNNLNKPAYLIPHFISDDGLKLNSHDVVALRKKYGIQTKNVLLSVGVINSSHKNMGYLIDEVSQMSSDWTLVLCGRVDEPELLKRGENKLGQRFIHVYLEREEVNSLYSIANVFVLASKQEGFGIVILEAMRQGLPIILHDRELFHWILGDSSSCVRMDKDGALSGYLKSKEDLSSWMSIEGERNSRYFKLNYSWSSLKTMYINLLFGQ